MELPVVNHKDYVAKIGDDHKFPINKFGELAKYLIEQKVVKVGVWHSVWFEFVRWMSRISRRRSLSGGCPAQCLVRLCTVGVP